MLHGSFPQRPARPAGDRGATAVEYTLIVMAVALAVVIGALALGNSLTGSYADSASCAANLAVCP